MKLSMKLRTRLFLSISALITVALLGLLLAGALNLAALQPLRNLLFIITAKGKGDTNQIQLSGNTNYTAGGIKFLQFQPVNPGGFTDNFRPDQLRVLSFFSQPGVWRGGLIHLFHPAQCPIPVHHPVRRPAGH